MTAMDTRICDGCDETVTPAGGEDQGEGWFCAACVEQGIRETEEQAEIAAASVAAEQERLAQQRAAECAHERDRCLHSTTITPPMGDGAYCADCGETMA